MKIEFSGVTIGLAAVDTADAAKKLLKRHLELLPEFEYIDIDEIFEYSDNGEPNDGLG